MKALSLTQPFATLLASGQKKIETRSWQTSYRGRLAIHASKGFPSDCQELCYIRPFAQALATIGFDRPDQLPRGAIVGLGTLVDCHMTIIARQAISETECAFGDYGAGRFAFFFSDLLRVEPIPCKGALGFWNVPDDVMVALLKQVPRTLF